MTEMVVRAGGGIVWRREEGGGVEIVLVHRPAYDDWSFPKGKLDPGETEAQAAVREVQEETGLRCRLGREVGTSAYAPMLLTYEHDRRLLDGWYAAG